jgi:hypothetical protein
MFKEMPGGTRGGSMPDLAFLEELRGKGTPKPPEPRHLVAFGLVPLAFQSTVRPFIRS